MNRQKSDMRAKGWPGGVAYVDTQTRSECPLFMISISALLANVYKNIRVENNQRNCFTPFTDVFTPNISGAVGVNDQQKLLHSFGG